MKQTIDCHLHTNFSPDGYSVPEDLVNHAIKIGLKHICITDHMDLFYHDPSFKMCDINEYISVISALKKKYAPQIYISQGMEVGYTPKNEKQNKETLLNMGFEYVISSIHEVNGSDCYFEKHYIGREREDTYSEYFDAVLKSVCVDYYISAVGHLGYVSRTAPYPDKQIKRGEFDAILSKIFSKMMERNLILELNTNVYGAGSISLPNQPILEKYYDMGGRLICFSSDAHKLVRVGESYTEAANLAQKIGFKNWTVIENGEFVPFKF